MAGDNLKTLLEEVRNAWLGSRRKNTSISNLPDYEAIRLINEGYRLIQKRFNVKISRNETVALTSGTAVYDVPFGCSGLNLREVRIVNEAADDEILLRRVDASKMREMFYLESTAEDSGDPAYWCYSEESAQKIIIRPVPTWTASGGIRLHFPPIGTDLERVYSPATATASASVTNASTTLTINKGTSDIAAIATLIRANDEIGLVETANFDAETVAEGSVIKWYPISTVTAGASSTAIVLAEAWTGATLSGKQFIVAQVSEIEREAPGLFGLAPAWHAAWRLLQRKGGEYAAHAEQYRAMWDEFIAETVIDEPGADAYIIDNRGKFAW